MIDAGIQSDFTDLDPESIGVADEDVTTVLDVGNFVERKEAAARCHRTQILSPPRAISHLPGYRRT